MGRFLSLAIFFIVAMGLILHFHIEIPWLTEWVGKLPGDLVIRKGGITLYFPITTSVLLSLLISILCRK